jgi:hypothetical protein
MATAAQIEANRANARRSTGPRTHEGKSSSALNNLRHGFRSQSVLLPGDDPEEYQALLDELTEHLSPEDLTEQRAVREMADAEWRLRRVRLFIQSALTRKIEELRPGLPPCDPVEIQARAFEALHDKCSQFAQYLRYETKYERQYSRAYAAWTGYQDSKRRAADAANRAALRSLMSGARSAGAPLDDDAGDDGLEALLAACRPKLVGAPPPAPAPPVAPPEPENQNLPDEPNSAPPPIPRGAPCPCGSGLKYKRCCGAGAPAVLHASPPRQETA